MSEVGPTSSAQNPKLLLGTAVITALTTIGVSFIGIVPQLRSGDKQELAQLRKDFEEFRERAGAGARPVGITGSVEPRLDTNKTLIISGTVRSDDGARLLTGYDVYLLAEGNNLLAATTDDAGKFTFLGVPAGVYSIVVRDSSNGRSGKGLLDDPGGEVQVIGAKVKYRIQH
jgi:carboxypeptidase family protein